MVPSSFSAAAPAIEVALPPSTATSPAESRRSMSSSTTNCSSRRAIPLMNVVSMRVPMRGGGAIWLAVMSTTSSTASASAPTTVASPSSATSRMMMQVSTVRLMAERPSLRRKSMTGTTCPRRLMTPTMKGGVRGTFVGGVYASTSRMRLISMAKCSRSSKNVRYCALADDMSLLMTTPCVTRLPCLDGRPREAGSERRQSARLRHCRGWWRPRCPARPHTCSPAT